MLEAFVVANRDAIIARAQARVATRTSPKPSDVELTNGIPVFLDQLGDALRLAKSSDVSDHEQLSKSAGRHGHDLLRMGLTFAQVVLDYGDVCQAITELAVEQEAPIPADEFQTLNLCLDDAIAGAVTGYARQRERAIAAEGTSLTTASDTTTSSIECAPMPPAGSPQSSSRGSRWTFCTMRTVTPRSS